MNLYPNKLSKFTKTNNIEMDGKINLYFPSFDCVFKKFEIVYKEEINDLFKV